jgi:hypothetical protein
VWYLRVADPTLRFLDSLRMTPAGQMVKQDDFPHLMLEWERFLGNQNTLPFLEKPIQKLNAIHDVLQGVSRELLFPEWVMDRFKEALNQYVRGEWLSSISLCGDIVEFIVNEFWTAYSMDIAPERRKTPSDSARANLRTLLESKIIDEEDYDRLLCVRQSRDNHVHDYLRNRLLKDYSTLLRSDNLEVFKNLSEFFAKENMGRKYAFYLEYALKHFSEFSNFGDAAR